MGMTVLVMIILDGKDWMVRTDMTGSCIVME